MKRVSLNQQIEEVERELHLRTRAAPPGGMTANQFAYCTDRMRAAARSLRWLRDNAALIRERCPELFAKDGAR